MTSRVGSFGCASPSLAGKVSLVTFRLHCFPLVETEDRDDGSGLSVDFVDRALFPAIFTKVLVK
jgi:hypothetical protein